jgi:hypothetical protein
LDLVFESFRRVAFSFVSLSENVGTTRIAAHLIYSTRPENLLANSTLTDAGGFFTFSGFTEPVFYEAYSSLFIDLRPCSRAQRLEKSFELFKPFWPTFVDLGHTA